MSHPSPSLLLEAAAVLPEPLFPCESLSVSGSDGGFFSFSFFFIKKCNIWVFEIEMDFSLPYINY